MVSLLGLGLILKFNIISPRGVSTSGFGTARVIGILVVALCIAAVGWAVWQSKREGGDIAKTIAEEQ